MRISWLLVSSKLYRVFVVAPLLATRAFAQAPSASIAGTVGDPAGALIPQAEISLSSDLGPAQTVQSDSLGAYRFSSLAPGTYSIVTKANGFADFQKDGIRITAGQMLRFNIVLRIGVQEQQVTVSGQGMDTSPDKNGGAIIFKGKDLDALSDDPQDLQSELQAIAGSDPEAGTQFFVDGFSGGKLPPKSSIREIRINQNPYSAQYDSLGMGRIEIFTKPGTDKLHGDLFISGNNSSFNSRNPYVQQQPPYYSTFADGDINGPITKHISYFMGGYYVDQKSQSFINAIILDSGFQPQPFTQAFSSPSSNTNLAPRLDFQLGKIHTISLRYQLNRSQQTSSLTSQFALPSQAINSENTEQVWQFSDTQAYGEKLVNETRFQYIRDRNNQTSRDFTPTINVQGAFTGGGNNLGDYRDNQDHYELQDYISVAYGNHFFKFGVRYRSVRDANRSTGGFNGQFIFPSITAYQITQQGLASGLTPQQIRAAGGGASQFSIATGNPNIVVSVQDAGLYAEDDWKLRSNMTFSYGLRFETQTGMADNADFAPRFGYAWSIGTKKDKPPVAVLRAGIGIFYQRFASTNILNAERQDGVRQQSYVVNAPDFYPEIPSTATLSPQVSPTVYRISPLLHAPYSVQEGLSLEKTFAKKLNISLNYIHMRGVDLLLTRNINAPLPGTYDPDVPTSGIRPFGGNQNIYQYETEGALKRNRFFANVGFRGKSAGLFGYYMLSFAKANTGGGSFPSNQYDLHVDYGRASNDIHHRLFMGGYVRLPYKFSINPFLIYQSSAPFNITVGQDLNGDAQFNDRPAFATDLSRSSVYRTRWGNFDASPLPGQKIIPVNYGTGPSSFTANFRLSRSFSFGPVVPNPGPATPPSAAKAQTKPQKPEIERRYHLNLGVAAQNAFNHVNPAPPVGVLTSSLFGKSTALGSNFSSPEANRTIYLNLGFSF